MNNRNKKNNQNYWIIGKHAVETALKNSKRIKYHLCATKENFTSLSLNDLQIKTDIMSRAEISKITDNQNTHQGIALLVKPLEANNLNSYLENNRENKKSFIILDQITDAQNIGAIIRSASAFSASGIIILDKNSPNENSIMAKAAVGTLEFMPLFKVTNLVQTLNKLKKYNFWNIGLDAQADQTLKQLCDKTKIFSENIGIVMGSEGKGLRELVRNNCDMTAKINIERSIESLNVSVALAITLYEINRT
jgi:23S rRNA (guanosine2251-2'-O)-methyltransferase